MTRGKNRTKKTPPTPPFRRDRGSSCMEKLKYSEGIKEDYMVLLPLHVTEEQHEHLCREDSEEHAERINR